MLLADRSMQIKSDVYFLSVDQMTSEVIGKAVKKYKKVDSRLRL